MKLAGAALLLLLGPACAPVLSHGPRVEPGLFAGGTAGLLPTQDSATAPEILTPAWTSYLRYGFTGKTGGAAGSLALSVGNGIEGDVYLQLPPRGEWAYGAGTMASRGYVMPYVQFGRSFLHGHEVYTTQAYVRREDFNGRLGLDAGPSEVRPRYWASSLAIRQRRGALGASLEVTGAFGHYDERAIGVGNGPPPAAARRRLRAVTASVTADVNLARFLAEVAAVTRRPIPRRPPGEMPP